MGKRIFNIASTVFILITLGIGIYLVGVKTGFVRFAVVYQFLFSPISLIYIVGPPLITVWLGVRVPPGLPIKSERYAVFTKARKLKRDMSGDRRIRTLVLVGGFS